MARYVNHPHGLILGSGNSWSHEGQGDYRAVVMVQPYSFKQRSISNIVVKTPAQQIIPQTKAWLERNVGVEGQDWIIAEKSVLFKRRDQALSFIRMIVAELTGMAFRQ